MPMSMPIPYPESRKGPSLKEAVEKAEDIVQELRTALGQQGIKLPSLGVDPLTVVRDEPTPLVELGRCTPQVAALLVRALRRDDDTAGSRTA